MEKNWAGPFFPHPDLWKHQPYPVMNMQTTFAFHGVGKNWADPFFSHPNKIKHQPCADGYLGGEKLCWSVIFHPDKWKHQPYPVMNTYIPILLFRGWGKTGPAHSFPTLTSESISLVQKLGYLGGEKLGRPILSQFWLVKASTLPCHEYTYNLCFSGGGEKLGRFFPHPD